MDRVNVVSEIPANHPGKRGIENAVREAFRATKGAWAVAIRSARGGTWWLLRIEGPGFEQTLIVDPPEQKPAIIQARIQEVLRQAGVVVVTSPPEDRSLVELLDCWLPPTSQPRTRNVS